MPVGTVASFDDAVGVGSVRDASSGCEHFFHCTAIADGTRTIPAGTPVQFEVVAGGRGQWEAAALVPVSADAL